jgi:hypothetical protein
MAENLPVVAPPAIERKALVLGKDGFEFDFDGAWRFAQGLIAGRMVPKGIDNPGAVIGLIQAGRELGLPTMFALSNLTFTNGRLGVMGDAAKAIVRKAGVLEPGTDFTERYTGEPYTPEWTCFVGAHRKGMKEPFERDFSIADAIGAGLIQLRDGRVFSRKGSDWITYGPWSTYTRRMLMYRAIGFLFRDYFSDVLGGAALAEELRDIPEDVRPVVRESTTVAGAPLPPAPEASPDADPLLADATVIDITAEPEPPAANPAPAGDAVPDPSADIEQGQLELGDAPAAEGASDDDAPIDAGRMADEIHAELVAAARAALTHAGAKTLGDVRKRLTAAGLEPDAAIERTARGSQLALEKLGVDALNVLIESLRSPS